MGLSSLAGLESENIDSGRSGHLYEHYKALKPNEVDKKSMVAIIPSA